MGRATTACWLLGAQVCRNNYRMLPSPKMAISIRTSGPRSRRRPLSATQHHPTTSLVGISLHCNEPWRFVSSVLTTFCTATHCISIVYKTLLFQCVTGKWRKSNSYTNDTAYSNLEWTYGRCWRDNELTHWSSCYFDCKVLLRRTEEEGSGRRHDRSRITW